jgi:hypothetical protein
MAEFDFDVDEIKRMMRSYIGDIVDNNDFKFIFKPCYNRSKTLHLFNCMMLTRKYPIMHEYLKALIKTFNGKELSDIRSNNYPTIHSVITVLEQISEESIQMLIDMGMNHNNSLNCGIKALFFLPEYCDQHCLNVVKLLVRNGYDINSPCDSNYVTLIDALRRTDFDKKYIETLLDFGATYNLKEMKNYVHNKNINLFNELLEARSAKNVKPATKA